MYYITSHRPASIAARPNWRGRSDLSCQKQIPHRVCKHGIRHTAITLQRLSTPRFGAMNYTAIGCSKRIRQPATSGGTNFKIAVKGRILAEFVANASLRIEHEDWFLDRITDDTHGTRKIGIARDENICLRTLFICILEHFRRNVHIRQLFSRTETANISRTRRLETFSTNLIGRFHPLLLLAVISFDDLNTRAIAQRVEILVLPSRPMMVGRFVYYARRKVFDHGDFMIIAQKRLDEKHEIQPFVS